MAQTETVEVIEPSEPNAPPHTNSNEMWDRGTAGVLQASQGPRCLGSDPMTWTNLGDYTREHHCIIMLVTFIWKPLAILLLSLTHTLIVVELTGIWLATERTPLCWLNKRMKGSHHQLSGDNESLKQNSWFNKLKETSIFIENVNIIQINYTYLTIYCT